MTNEEKLRAEALLAQNGFKFSGGNLHGPVTKWHCTDGDWHMDVVFFRSDDGNEWYWDVRTQVVGKRYGDLMGAAQGGKR